MKKKTLIIVFSVLIIAVFLIAFVFRFKRSHIYNSNNSDNSDNSDNYIRISDSKLPFTLTVKPGYDFKYWTDSEPAVGIIKLNKNNIKVFDFSMEMKKLLDRYVDEDGYFPQTFTTKEKRIPQLVDDGLSDRLVKIKTGFLDGSLYRINTNSNESLKQTYYIEYYELYKEEDGRYYYDYPVVDNKYQIVFTCIYDPELSKEEMDEELMKEEMEEYLKECDRIVESIQWVGWDE